MGLSFHAVRERLVLLVALVVAVAGPMLTFSLAAEAALPGHTAPGEFTAFEIDGDRDGANDWAGLPYGADTTAQGRSSTGIISHEFVDDACESSPDDMYDGSIAGEPFPWPTSNGNVNAKTDICELGVAYEVVDVDGVDHYVMYAFLGRVADATGDLSTVLVLDRPDSEIGDTLVEFDFDPSSGSTFPIHTWNGTDWVATSVTAGVDPVQRGTNSTEGNEGTFVEVALDLTALGLFPPIDPETGAQECGGLTMAGAASFTGNDANSALKDRVAADFDIVNCGQIDVVKAGAPNGAGPFGFDANFADAATDPDGDEDFGLSIGDPAHSAADLPVGDYTIVELLDAANEDVAPDFVLDGVACEVTGVGSGTSTFTTEGVTDGVTVSLGVADTVTCTFTNEQAGRIVVEKATVGGDGTFAFSGAVNGEITTIDGATADGDALVADVAPGTHDVTETVPTGWALTGASCDDESGTLAVDGDAGVLSGIEVAAGEVVTCTFTNAAQSGSLEITKSTVGGDGTFTFELTPEGGEPFTREVTTTDGSGSVVVEGLVPGEVHTVTEVDPGASWIAGELSCQVVHADETVETVDPAAGFAVAPGDEVSCEVTNTATATVVVDKVTTPAGDPTVFDFQFGPLDGDATDFGLSDADMPASFGGLAPGDYLLAELATDGWVLQDVSCDSDAAFVDGAEATITVGAGDVVTCTYTNARRGPVLVDKTVTAGPVDNGDGTWDVSYEITVTSESGVQEGYDLHDELRFGDGIEVVAATASSEDAAVNPAWDGVTDPAMTDLTQGIDPLDEHTFTVTATATIASTTSSASRDCELAAGEDGTGFLNEVTLLLVEGDDAAAQACVPAPTETDVAITKSGTAAVTLPAEGGSATVAYTLEVVNEGPSAAEDVVVTDVLPAELTLDEVTSSVGTCTTSDDGFACALGTMAVGTVATIEVTTTTVDDVAAGDITNVAEVTTSTPDPDPSNDTDDHVTEVARQLPHTGLDLPWLALLALLLVMAGVATREVGRSQRTG